METSVLNAIEKIKLHQQDNDAKHKEMREYDAAVISLNHAIRQTIVHVTKSKQEREQLKNTIDKLQSQLITEREERNALVSTVTTLQVDLDELQNKSANGVSAVWNLRSTLLDAVKNVSNKCDVWALFTKPPCAEVAPIKDPIINTLSCNEDRLKKSINRRDIAIAGRNRLISEPELGEEYIRVKNALQYSSNMIEKLTS